MNKINKLLDLCQISNTFFFVQNKLYQQKQDKILPGCCRLSDYVASSFLRPTDFRKCNQPLKSEGNSFYTLGRVRWAIVALRSQRHLAARLGWTGMRSAEEAVMKAYSVSAESKKLFSQFNSRICPFLLYFFFFNVFMIIVYTQNCFIRNSL